MFWSAEGSSVIKGVQEVYTPPIPKKIENFSPWSPVQSFKKWQFLSFTWIMRILSMNINYS
jgi:hypothetical protein